MATSDESTGSSLPGNMETTVSESTGSNVPEDTMNTTVDETTEMSTPPRPSPSPRPPTSSDRKRKQPDLSSVIVIDDEEDPTDGSFVIKLKVPPSKRAAFMRHNGFTNVRPMTADGEPEQPDGEDDDKPPTGTRADLTGADAMIQHGFTVCCRKEFRGMSADEALKELLTRSADAPAGTLALQGSVPNDEQEQALARLARLEHQEATATTYYAFMRGFLMSTFEDIELDPQNTSNWWARTISFYHNRHRDNAALKTLFDGFRQMGDQAIYDAFRKILLELKYPDVNGKLLGRYKESKGAATSASPAQKKFERGTPSILSFIRATIGQTPSQTKMASNSLVLYRAAIRYPSLLCLPLSRVSCFGALVKKLDDLYKNNLPGTIKNWHVRDYLLFRQVVTVGGLLELDKGAVEKAFADQGGFHSAIEATPPKKPLAAAAKTTRRMPPSDEEEEEDSD